jgi:GT2 family glycosyltransferase
MVSKLKLGVVVVTYNSQYTIRECLEALISQCGREDEIFVYDNGSSDDTPEILKNYESKVSLKLSLNNFGFSYACNWCVQTASDFSHVAFVNPDAVVGLDLISRAKETLADGLVSLVGFSCKDINGLEDKNFRRYPSILSNMLTIIDSTFFRFNFKRRETFDINRHYLDGSCMFLDREVFVSAHQFQNLFLYGEDVILCDSLKRQGITAIYHSDVSYLHLRGASSSSVPGERSWSMLPNMVYSEFFYLRNRSFLFRCAYLFFKFFESSSLVIISMLFLRKDKIKRDFFRKKLLFLIKFSWSFFVKGGRFNHPEFHILSKESP